MRVQSPAPAAVPLSINNAKVFNRIQDRYRDLNVQGLVILNMQKKLHTSRASFRVARAYVGHVDICGAIARRTPAG